MQNLLIRPDIMQLLHGNKEAPQQTFERRKNEVEKKKRYRSAQLAKQLKGAGVYEERNAERAIRTHITESQNVTKMVQQNIRNQGDELNKRLARRRNSHRRGHSGSFIKNTGTGKVILSESYSNNANINSFEDELEKIMEQFVEGKFKIMADIRRQYNTQINQIRIEDPEDNAISQLEQIMEDEIKQAVETLENQRKEQISDIRIKYFN